MLSEKPEEKLLIFVHGFGGDPLNTWSKFHDYLTADSDVKGTDLLFYHYDSKKTQAYVSGMLFDELLEKILIQPNFFASYLYNDEDQNRYKRPDTFKYKKIFIVAHSFGAIVTRKAMVFGNSKKRSWCKISKMMLFAPAHNGAKAILPIQQMLSIIPFYIGYKRYKTPTLDDVDLSSPNCKLAELKEETNKIQMTTAGDYTIAHSTVFSLRDNVVNNDSYLKDTAAVVEFYKDHGKVCKPSDDYRSPYEEVKKFLLAYGI